MCAERKLLPIEIFTDGSSRGNPGPGGYGVILRCGEHYKELSGGFAETTNNRMELTAVIVGLEAVKRPNAETCGCAFWRCTAVTASVSSGSRDMRTTR